MRRFLYAAALALLIPGGLSAQQAKSGNIRYVEELTAVLNQNVRTVQDENARLEIKITELEQKLSQLTKKEQENAELIQSLKRQLTAESAARETQMNEILKQIKALASMPAPVPVTPPKERKQVYEEYTVTAGATLSVIAQAYKVSVQDIKKANNLKSDLLQIGQKLKIPVK